MSFGKQNRMAIGWCILVAFGILFVCSRSSFLYPCNDWNDANSYFTMGKALMNGQIIYRDLYDQKGPYLYLLYGIAYLISHDSFAGVFLIEIICISAFLFSCYQVMRLYCSRTIACLLLPVLAAVILSSKCFYWGGAAEEFCLPLLGFSFYHSLRYFKEQYPENTPSFRLIFFNGIFAGIIMQVKYTMLGFYFAWMGMMVLAYLLKKDFKGFFKGCLIFLGAMAATAVPWLIFFGIHGALGDWYQCYIYNNVFLYSNLQDAGNTLGNRVYTLAKLLYWLIWDNISYFIWIILGFLVLLVHPRVRWIEKGNLLALSGFLFLGIYIGGSTLPYYAIPLTVFTVCGFAAAGGFFQQLAKKEGLRDRLSGTALRFLPIVSCLLIFAGSIFLSLRLSMNTPFMKQEKNSYFLYQFKEIVSQENEPTLLNINCLDAGLYTVADILPSCKFFQTNGIGFDELYTQQELYVAQARTQFILARDYYPDCIWENYEMVSEAPYEWDGNHFTYYLFKRKA